MPDETRQFAANWSRPGGAPFAHHDRSVRTPSCLIDVPSVEVPVRLDCQRVLTRVPPAPDRGPAPGRVPSHGRGDPDHGRGREQGQGPGAHGRTAILGQDPHSRPATTDRSPAPFVHASDERTELDFRAQYRAFVDAFRAGVQRLRERASELADLSSLWSPSRDVGRGATRGTPGPCAPVRWPARGRDLGIRCT